MRSHLYVATLASTLAIVGIASVASAQQATRDQAPDAQSMTVTEAEVASAAGSDTPQARALVHYERGRAYYAAGRYRSAINELETAIHLDPAGFNLFFDLGLVYERTNQPDRAVTAYRHYLEHVTDPAERERAERIIQRVDGGRAELADINSRHGRADAAFWTLTATSLAALVGGGVAVVLASQRGGLSMMQADNLRIGGDIALIGGGALAITAAVLYLVRDGVPPNTPVCVTAGIGPQSVVVGFTF
jgi:tetratricopeptide (TPR) repeat protein